MEEKNNITLTIEIVIDRDTVPSFGTIRRDGQIGAKNISNNLMEMGMEIESIDVNVAPMISSKWSRPVQ